MTPRLCLRSQRTHLSCPKWLQLSVRLHLQLGKCWDPCTSDWNWQGGGIIRGDGIGWEQEEEEEEEQEEQELGKGSIKKRGWSWTQHYLVFYLSKEVLTIIRLYLFQAQHYPPDLLKLLSRYI